MEEYVSMDIADAVLSLQSGAEVPSRPLSLLKKKKKQTRTNFFNGTVAAMDEQLQMSRDIDLVDSEQDDE